MKDADRSDDASTEDAATAAKDVDLGLRFVHLMGTQQQARVAELSASFYALLEVLIAEGKIDTQAYEERRRVAIVRENERTSKEAGVHIAPIPDKYAIADLPDLDCEDLLPICRGRCCKILMVLSVQDLDERVIRWQYGLPYVIEQGADGRCVHQSDGRCSVYAKRPGACRVYDCRQDPRIWKDFARRLPAD